jgi:hypothetical protein
MVKHRKLLGNDLHLFFGFKLDRDRAVGQWSESVERRGRGSQGQPIGGASHQLTVNYSGTIPSPWINEVEPDNLTGITKEAIQNNMNTCAWSFARRPRSSLATRPPRATECSI